MQAWTLLPRPFLAGSSVLDTLSSAAQRRQSAKSEYPNSIHRQCLPTFIFWWRLKPWLPPLPSHLPSACLSQVATLLSFQFFGADSHCHVYAICSFLSHACRVCRGKYLPSIMAAPCNAPLYSVFTNGPGFPGGYAPTNTRETEMPPAPAPAPTPTPAPAPAPAKPNGTANGTVPRAAPTVNPVGEAAHF